MLQWCVIKIFNICALADKFFLFIDFIYFITKAFLASLLGMSFTFVPSSGVKKCQEGYNAYAKMSWWMAVGTP
jgi:hypothetical protein